MSDLKNPISAVDQLRGVRGDQPPVARNPSISVGAFQTPEGVWEENFNKEPEVNLPAPVNRRHCSHRHLLHPRFEVEQKRG